MDSKGEELKPVPVTRPGILLPVAIFGMLEFWFTAFVVLFFLGSWSMFSSWVVLGLSLWLLLVLGPVISFKIGGGLLRGSTKHRQVFLIMFTTLSVVTFLWAIGGSFGAHVAWRFWFTFVVNVFLWLPFVANVLCVCALLQRSVRRFCSSMMVEARCSGCRTFFKVPPGHGIAYATCPKCDKEVEITSR
jgi:hypothetical protein